MIILNKYKVVDINRFKRFIFVSVLLISMILFTSLFTIKAYSKDIQQYNYITVQKGDTLWSIASNYAQDGEIREFIYIISKENNINNSIIYPNDIIKVPLSIMK
jgi:LysM domain-containing protein